MGAGGRLLCIYITFYMCIYIYIYIESIRSLDKFQVRGKTNVAGNRFLSLSLSLSLFSLSLSLSPCLPLSLSIYIYIYIYIAHPRRGTAH